MVCRLVDADGSLRPHDAPLVESPPEQPMPVPLSGMPTIWPKPSTGDKRSQHCSWPDNRHFVRVYAILNPLRSALRCESLPGAATIIARSQPWSKA